MIKIETKYDNDTDTFTWDYYSERSHTLEHLAVIQSIFDLIIENDKQFKNYDDIFSAVKITKKSQTSSKEAENEQK